MDNLLELIDVNKKYPSFSLHNVSFSVPSGSIVGFIGRNGAGKTTTLKGIMNLLRFDSGTLNAFGLDMKSHEWEIKQKIGFTLSELNYYPNKTIATMAKVTGRFYSDFSMEKFDSLCTLFSLDKNKRLEQLSSGMKIKFSLALALSHKAELLILDEPTSGLDPVSREEILDILEKIVQKDKRAVLFSTHITSDLDRCATHIVYIKKGEIVFQGTKTDFIGSYNLFQCSTDRFQDDPRILSHKKHGDRVEGLIFRENKDFFPDFTFRDANLEEIMLYLEKEGTLDEKFDL